MPRAKKFIQKRRINAERARALRKEEESEENVERLEAGAAGSARPPHSPQPSTARAPVTPQPSTSHQPPPPPPRTSAQKRKRFSTVVEDEPKPLERIVIVKDDMLDLASNIICSNCYTNTIVCSFVDHQLDTFIKMKCSKCPFVAVDTSGKSKTGTKGIYQVTVMAVYVMMLLGWWYRGLERLSAFLSLNHFSIATYAKYAKVVTQAAVLHTKEQLQENRVKVIAFYGNELSRQPDSDGVLDIDVTYDGTWHTRGHKSLLGAGAVIDANTGLVVDYQNMSKYCELCTKKKKSVANSRRMTSRRSPA